MEKQLQRKILELNALELQLNELEQYRALIEKEITELKLLEVSLEKIPEIEPETEIFSLIGSDTFISTKLKDNKKVLVNIGAKIFVKKTIEEAKKSIESKIKNLEEKYIEIEENMERIATKMLELEEEIKKISKV